MNFGGFNLHVDITFDDGIIWLARFRLLQINQPSTEKVNFDRMSEVATYQLLRSTTIPVPQVFDFAPDGDNNQVGAGYILLEKVQGRPMNWFQASQPQKEYIIQQLADIHSA